MPEGFLGGQGSYRRDTSWADAFRIKAFVRVDHTLDFLLECVFASLWAGAAIGIGAAVLYILHQRSLAGRDAVLLLLKP